MAATIQERNSFGKNKIYLLSQLSSQHDPNGRELTSIFFCFFPFGWHNCLINILTQTQTQNERQIKDTAYRTTTNESARQRPWQTLESLRPNNIVAARVEDKPSQPRVFAHASYYLPTDANVFTPSPLQMTTTAHQRVQYRHTHPVL